MLDPRATGRAPERIRPVLLFYCQHASGIGQLTRAFALAHALAAPFRVIMLSGAPVPRGVPVPDSIEVIDLPPLAGDAEPDPASGAPSWDLTAAQLQRHGLVSHALRRLHPAMVLVELFPFGHRPLTGEILSLIRAARGQQHPARIVCSLPDILPDTRPQQQHHDDRARWLAHRYFDAVLVHADPGYVRLEESFRPSKPLAVPVHHTGYVLPVRPAAPQVPREPRILVSAGGGSTGFPLFVSALEAYARLAPATGLGLRIVAGPFLPEPDWAALQRLAHGRSGVELVRQVPDMVDEMCRARLSISQFGYGTALDIVVARVPALVVPHAAPGRNEQVRRAETFARLGAVRHLPAESLDSARLSTAIEETLQFSPRPAAPALDGAGKAATLLMQIAGFGRRRSRESRHHA